MEDWLKRILLFSIENHILEDVNKCVLALQENDADALDRTAGAIRGRSARVCNVVTSEMDNYEPVMPNFAQKVEMAVEALSASPQKEIDENEFIDASRLVYDGVREIRRAVLMNRLDVDSEDEMDGSDLSGSWVSLGSQRSRASSAHTADYDEYPDISGINNTRDAYRLVSEEEKQKIAAQVETFRTEKNKFDREVAKWDDTGNDIIVLAKQMCMIMMEMTDFTRGKGPLKTTMDVINAAKKISEYGTKLDKLARTIADQCPESSTKKDLIAYLQRIALYCHQLNITSKVKADVQNISGNLIVSGSPIVVWKMKAPEKKPLVRREKPEEVRAKVRKGSQKKNIAPIKALTLFLMCQLSNPSSERNESQLKVPKLQIVKDLPQLQKMRLVASLEQWLGASAADLKAAGLIPAVVVVFR
ncbi:hypothetical protein HPB51_024986 [Rhipicephalus microplus]|uniref:Catenin alpha n=1 Tax=Rhipicephalus microplus TaxID=6941 RepID=A0A9J6EVM0_RHIMP|nr:hypothetical protein HPB51_024986 [Rhipicephalus microplus]